jgi:hypothetical protein
LKGFFIWKPTLKRSPIIITTVFWFALTLPCGGSDPQTDFPDAVEQPLHKAIEIRQSTQKAEESWSAERSQLTADYEQRQEAVARLRRQLQELSGDLEQTQLRVAEKETQLAEMDRISDQIEPFLDATRQTLEKFIRRDTPFLTAERAERMTRLQRVLDDSQIPLSEKYRKTMEALFVEAEYGNTVEIYEDTITIAAETVLVGVFRLGRISLFFQTLDQARCGYFNTSDQTWQWLPRRFNRSVRLAMDIGANRRPAELLSLPLGRLVAP